MPQCERNQERTHRHVAATQELSRGPRKLSMDGETQSEVNILSQAVSVSFT